ncbi:PREDICTED: uncharacterized protein LOC105569583 isoform X2 [Vollenhovia emeryi]|nr:PREDICTED: uncharacterized protein LOC105569583 isoform X2 [Vollenhovia emeryi]XP_011881554.1 PREDICTED: uncharacterized protein LOC105569583 isoform X2 [Vollenhovia emeryi]
MPCCFLCYELVDSDRIFDLTKDKNVIFNPLRKIRSIFNDDVFKNSSSKLICLTCRYNLDVLYDLKRIYQETITNLKALINEEINYSNFPKVHTDVVNRKTTITTFPDITFYGSVNSSDSDSENEDIMPRRKRHAKGGRKVRNNAQVKLQNKSNARNCDRCCKTVAGGIDMYRIYRTGLTVCKNCWITIDPGTDKTRRTRQIRSTLAETKLCAVFLTDVLNQEPYRKKKTHKEMEKKENNDMSCNSLQEETRYAESSPLNVSYKTRNSIVNGKARRGRKRHFSTMRSIDDVERTPSKVTKLSKDHTNTNEMKSTEVSIVAKQQSSSRLMSRRGRKRKISNRSSDSDESLELRKNHRDNLNDRVTRTNRKKLKFILGGVGLNARSESTDETSNEDSPRSKAKGATSLSSVSTKKGNNRSTRSRTSSSSISSVEIPSSTEFKSPKPRVHSEIKTEYACDKCDKTFDTKLSNAKHRLTHFKQAALKLEKLPLSSVKGKQEMEVELQDDKFSEEESRSNRTASTDKHTDDPSEEIAINVEDDTDEDINEEIFSTREKVKKTVETEISEDVNVSDKPDTVKSKSHVEEESTNDENVKTKESEQCEKSTVIPDETVTLDTEDGGDRQVEDTTEDKVETSVHRDSDKNEDAQETAVTTEEDHNMDDKGEEMKNEVPSTEEENTITECNNEIGDVEDFHEETPHDSEMIRKSPILSIHDTVEDNKDYSESYENNLENNREEEIEREPKVSIMDEFPKEDTKEPENKVEKITLADQTETLSDSADTIINEDNELRLEKQQNKFDEENTEDEIITDVDKLNGTKDTFKPDLSNNEKYDKMKDSSEDDIAVVPVSSDRNNDRIKHEKFTEETAPTDSSREKGRLEEELKEIEKLVDDNAMNNKHKKMHENSTYTFDTSSTDAANEILQEVFNLAAAEVQQREENTKNSDEVELETLENISREIRKSADMPSLEPISIMEMDDNDITLN